MCYADKENPWSRNRRARRVHEGVKKLSKCHEFTIISSNFTKALTTRNVVRYIRSDSNKPYYMSRLAFTLNFPYFVVCPVKNEEFDVTVEGLSEAGL